MSTCRDPHRLKRPELAGARAVRVKIYDSTSSVRRTASESQNSGLSSSPRGVIPKNVGGKIYLLFALATASFVVGSVAAPSISHAVTSGGLTFSDINEEAWELQGCDGTCPSVIVIPSSVDGKPVTRIKHSIFYATSGITRVEIPASIENIGQYPFNYSSLQEIVIDPTSPHFKVIDNVLLSKDGTEVVGYPPGATATSLTIPSGVTKIRAGALTGNAVVSVSLPSSLQEVEAKGFNLSAMLTIELPVSLSTIGYDAFGASLTTFTVAAGNTTFSASDGVLFRGSALVRYPPARTATEYSVPPGTVRIEEEAFRYTYYLDSLIFPASLSVLADNALNGIPNLASIVVNAGNPIFSASDGVLFRGGTLAKYPPKRAGNSYSVPAGTTEIGRSAFDSATLLTSLLLPDSLRIIGYDGLVRLENLTSIDLPNGLTTLGFFSLAVTGLTTVAIPHTVTNWGQDVFAYSSVFQRVYLEGDAPPEPAFSSITAGAKIYRIVGTNGWPPLTETYAGLEQVAWDPAITTPRAPSVAALGQSVRVTANRGSGGLPTSYLATASPGGATCVIVTGETSCVVTGLSIGTSYTFTMTATKGATTTASSAASVGVNPLSSQVITFVNPGERVFSSVPFTVSPNSNSNLTVTLSSTTQEVCTVSGFSITMLSVGLCSLTARQAGDSTYAPATDVVRSFTITAAEVIEVPPTTTPSLVSTTSTLVVSTTSTSLVSTTSTLVVSTTSAPSSRKPSVTGTAVPVARQPASAVASEVAIGVSQTKVMIALKVPVAKKTADQVTTYVIQLTTSRGVTIGRTISARAGSSMAATLTGKKNTTYSITVSAVTKSGKKTTWKGPQVRTP